MVSKPTNNVRIDGGLKMTTHCFDRILIRRCLPLALVALSLCAGCSEKKSPPPQPRPELQPVVDWLGTYYRKSPPGSGWTVASVTAQGDQVQVTVAIPPEQSSAIMRQPANDQFRLVADRVCPRDGEALWRLLPPGSSITILPSVSGQVFIEVGCRP